MRNFEADKLIRIGDVMDLIENLNREDRGSHEVDFGDAGFHTIYCDEPTGINMEDLQARLLEEANND